VRAAATLRADLGLGPTDAVCPFDIADQMGIVVRLVALPTLEGMYSPQPRPAILVGVERPIGRQRYTCGHELGHHVFEHGTRLDQLEDEPTVVAWTPEEFLAQRFSSALMMPKFAVESAFNRRRWPIAKPTAEMVFIVAQELGVGFTTLLEHLERTLGSLSGVATTRLRRISLKKLRASIARFAVSHDVLVVDNYWERRSADVEVGDVVLLPIDASFRGHCAAFDNQPVPHLIANTPGVGHVSLASATTEVAIRVSRRKFTGLARYRHLEDAADET
jgi:IrrE N-terminal-like domain